jgi:hypothetical protein
MYSFGMIILNNQELLLLEIVNRNIDEIVKVKR